MKLIRRLLFLAMVYVAVQAAREQLSRPPEDRTWFGRVGLVPYDFRVPTAERVASTFWNPDDDRLFVKHAFGIGWTVNFAQALKIVNELRAQGRPAV